MCSDLLMASVCGALIGWNRETHDKPAGLRTYMLVSIGSASFLLLAIERAEQLREQAPLGLIGIHIGGGNAHWRL